MSTEASSAIVECLIKRDGGSKVEMADGTTYHFKPNLDGQHVAHVADMGHVTRFMQIPEGYKIISLLAESVSTMAAAVKHTAVGVVSQASTPDAIVKPGPDAIVITSEPPPNDGLTLPQPDAEGNYTPEQVDQLRQIFRTELGRPPSPKTKPETMIAQIEGIRVERQNGGTA